MKGPEWSCPHPESLHLLGAPARVNGGGGAPEGGGGRAGARRARGGPGPPRPEIQLRAF
jgi:hypothetical protein